MPAQPNGHPYIDTINFGTHYCAMYRWDSAEHWTILADQKKCRMIFPSSSVARSEAIRILMARRRIRAEKCGVAPEPVDPLQSELEQFLRDREGKAKSERLAVFGSAPAATVFPKRGKPVAVEHKKRRARA